MLMKLQATIETAALVVNRSALLNLLKRVQRVVPKRFPKPILTCVRLEATNGYLRVCATDSELSLYTQMPIDGDLPAVVVPCDEFIRRPKASKAPECSLRIEEGTGKLHVNGGRVEHALCTYDPADFPLVANEYVGDSIAVDAAELVTALKVCVVATAKEPSRYAIDGVLLESDSKVTRLVATDGRRLVVSELRMCDGELDGKAILPSRLLQLVARLTERDVDHLVLAVSRDKNDKGDELPGRIYVAGPDWLVASYECDGSFPVYRDVMPRSHSRFAVERPTLIETLSEVALATNLDGRMVCVDLYEGELHLSATAPGVGTAEADLGAEFLGGGDSEIHTAFNPSYLLDALKTLDGDRVVLDVAQNGFGSDRSVFGEPALLYAEHDPITRWVVMPVNAGLEPTRANLGSNHPEHLLEEASA
jgi:DNA polymerase-3 subunit beta